ncbi:hypothetical protein FIBSPDRAFT_901802 [Athelia psychrophila]|uniref:Uncharacterized protein n=1 Tax=Athelia psychrophila TaxID=1759441 RepID=A0A165WPV9_9AGAM|nr:hypothetical protein FIBSPDRAFT_901802 [Fibularhizoctonia sp. CBS 109695]
MSEKLKLHGSPRASTGAHLSLRHARVDMFGFPRFATKTQGTFELQPATQGSFKAHIAYRNPIVQRPTIVQQHVLQSPTTGLERASGAAGSIVMLPRTSPCVNVALRRSLVCTIQSASAIMYLRVKVYCGWVNFIALIEKLRKDATLYATDGSFLQRLPAIR